MFRGVSQILKTRYARCPEFYWNLKYFYMTQLVDETAPNTDTSGRRYKTQRLFQDS